MINVEQTIISQYGNSATITRLIHNMDQYLDPRTNFDDFYDFVWNVETAQGFGLDIWGKIVNVSRELTLEITEWFGFKESGLYPFGQRPFFSEPAATQGYTLADDAYRVLILTKAMANIAATTAPSLNQILQNLFAGRGKCYVNDLGKMRMRYVFEFALTDYEVAIITQSNALPRPAGVMAYLFTFQGPVFGFAEAGASASPFGQAPFISPEAVRAIV